jgi:predicted unusual protein kinase regulating ubiquinone biosynthesis (AarF/ABC1/UbiB family)
VPKLPTGRITRTARFGRMVGGAALKRNDPVAAADQIVAQLGQMKGAAMKIGQVLSMVDFDAVLEEHREEFKEKLAALRDDAPSVPFARLERMLREELGGPLEHTFSDFSREPVAAASIGQVHRATTLDGRDVAVKVQYPGVAEAVETDLRNMGMLFPLVRRLAPGLDVKALGDELRDRIAEELDYELEAQHQRSVARVFRGHPHVQVPAVDTALSTRRVLVTEFVEGAGFAEVKRGDEASRDRFAEIVYRFFWGLLTNERLVAGDPHPGNYLLAPDGRVCFLDFGLMRRIEPAYLDAERALARSVIAGDAGAVHRVLSSLGYLPDPDAFEPEQVFRQIADAGAWFFVPGFKRLDPDVVRVHMEATGSPRSPHFEAMRRQTVPPQALLLRRMEGLLFSVLGELRAGADWGALAREYVAGAAPSTPIGLEDRAFWTQRAPAVTWQGSRAAARLPNEAS